MNTIIISLPRTASSFVIRHYAKIHNLVSYDELFKSYNIHKLNDFCSTDACIAKLQPLDYFDHNEKYNIDNILSNNKILIIKPPTYLECYTSFIISVAMTNRDTTGETGKYWNLKLINKSVNAVLTPTDFYAQLKKPVTREESFDAIRYYTRHVNAFIRLNTIVKFLSNNIKIITPSMISSFDPSKASKLSKDLSQKTDLIDDWPEVKKEIEIAAHSQWEKINESL